MFDICEQSRCTGCMACANVCRHDAICIIPDEEGFDRPQIDEEKCVECGLCRDVCPVNSPVLRHTPSSVYSGWSCDEEVRLGSSSGGAFTEIARPVLESGGVVFGCALNDKLEAQHIWVDNIHDLHTKLSGSKYVQSRVGKSYQMVRKFLLQGRRVLFSGTPCQVAGLRNFLRRDYPNLLTVDLICHGVPSPIVFEDYKHHMEELKGGKLIELKFRCKESSWIFFNMHLKFQDEKHNEREYVGRYYDDPYLRGFLRDFFLRPSCHRCQYTSVQRVSDFTIADWWGYKKYSPIDKDFRYKGVSLLLVNTEKAEHHLPQVRMHLRRRTLQEAQRTNWSLSRPFAMPTMRSAFWHDYKSMAFSQLVKKYMSPESVSLDQQILQHHLNTDALARVVSLLILPRRAVRKMAKVIKPKIIMFEKTLKKVLHLPIRLRNNLYSKKQRRILTEQISKRGDKVIYLFCAPTHSNLGDQAQLLCWLRLFRVWYPEHEVIQVPTRYREPLTLMKIHEGLRKDDLLFIHSGYLLFDIHPELPFILEVVNAFYDRPVIILPQTVNLMREWSQTTVSRVFNAHPNLILLCRDEISLTNARALFPGATLKAIPDVVTSLIGSRDFLFPNNKRRGVMLCVRNDVEKFYTDEQIKNLKRRFDGIRVNICDTTIKAQLWDWDKDREKLIKKMLRKMASYQVVITDRFHGTIFAQIANTPTIVISSTDHKLSSGVKWFPQDVFGGNISFAASLDEAFEKASLILARQGMIMENPAYFKEKYYDGPLNLLSTSQLHGGG